MNGDMYRDDSVKTDQRQGSPSGAIYLIVWAIIFVVSLIWLVVLFTMHNWFWLLMILVVILSGVAVFGGISSLIHKDNNREVPPAPPR